MNSPVPSGMKVGLDSLSSLYVYSRTRRKYKMSVLYFTKEWWYCFMWMDFYILPLDLFLMFHN